MKTFKEHLVDKHPNSNNNDKATVFMLIQAADDFVKLSLVDFMIWYKNNVPIGTQKGSKEIVNDFINSTNK